MACHQVPARVIRNLLPSGPHQLPQAARKHVNTIQAISLSAASEGGQAPVVTFQQGKPAACRLSPLLSTVCSLRRVGEAPVTTLQQGTPHCLTPYKATAL